MTGLEFTKEAAKRLEKAYLKRDVVAQRLEAIRQLDLSSGESVLDVGCGPGYLCESMAEIVGPSGAVVGIDVSADLIASAMGEEHRHGFHMTSATRLS